MIDPGVFSTEPWALVEPRFAPEHLAVTESLFALSNGHVGLRGNLDEGEPHGMPGSYLNGVFETVALPYAELAYGNPEQGQSMIDVTNGKLFRLLVDDEPLDVRLGQLRRHERRLDLRAGTLTRDVEWVSPAGQAVRARSERLVSFPHRGVAAICYEVEPLDAPARLVLQSVLVANEPLPTHHDDPRGSAVLQAPLVCQYHGHHDCQVAMGHRTARSGIQLAAALDHEVEGPASTTVTAESQDDLARVTISTELEPGQTLRVIKYLGYAWSSRRSMPALRDQVDAVLASARRSGWRGLCDGQRQYLDEVWERADVEIDGDPQLQFAIRYAIFQVVQAAARAEQRAIPAKGLTGRGYDGHTFWDMESYVLPVLTYLLPEATRDALLWRHSTLELACARAAQLRLRGATFPWRTIRGEECSGYWPASTAAFHINAAIADAARRYVEASNDQAFHGGAGLDIAVETARLWTSLGHHDAEGKFRIDGVTGPDEYTALVDNNTFTNLMAARNLNFAADCCRRFPQRAAEIGVEPDEPACWGAAADAMTVPFDEELGVTSQSEGFTRYRPWDFDATSPEDYPLLLHFPYYQLYSSQVVKQADLVFALYVCGESFSAEQKRKDFAFYDPITVGDSSLSASIQSIVAAEVGELPLALDYLRETALTDLTDRTGTGGDGVHLAALAGTWLAVVAGLGGMRDYGGLQFAPRLPDALRAVSFRLTYQGRRLIVRFDAAETTYTLERGEPLSIVHHGDAVELVGNTPVRLANPAPAPPPSGEGFTSR